MSDYDTGYKGAPTTGRPSVEYQKGWDARTKHINAISGGGGGGGRSSGGCAKIIIFAVLLTGLAVVKVWASL
jgi:hypothetical protein